MFWTNFFFGFTGLHRDSLPLQGITNTGRVMRRSHQPLHWGIALPQPQQQQQHQRCASAWNATVKSLSMPPSNTNSLDLQQTINTQGNITSNMGGSHIAMNNGVLDTSSQMLGTSGPPPSIKSGPVGCSGSTSNIAPSDHDDEWKNIHVVSVIKLLYLQNKELKCSSIRLI